MEMINPQCISDGQHIVMLNEEVHITDQSIPSHGVLPCLRIELDSWNDEVIKRILSSLPEKVKRTITVSNLYGGMSYIHRDNIDYTGQEEEQEEEEDDDYDVDDLNGIQWMMDDDIDIPDLVPRP